MASHQQVRRQSTRAQEEERGQAQGHHGAHGQQQRDQAMNLEEIGKYRAEAQQRSVDAIRTAEERFNKANQHGTVAASQAPGATVISHHAGTKQQEERHGQGQGGGAHGGTGGHAGTEAKQWLADTASEARERCNRAMGVGTNPTAGQGTKKSSSGQEGGQVHGQLTRQGEMGHGRDVDRSSDAEAARAAVEMHDTRGKQQSAMDTVGATAKGAEAKDAGAHGARAAAEKTQEATQRATGTAADYTKQTAWKVKDVTAGAAGTTVDYAKQAAVKAKDVTASTGATAADYAKAAAEKAKEAAVATAKTTAGYTQQAAVKAKDVTVSTGAQVAQKATELTADAAHKVAEYAREKAEQGKEAAARAADQAEEPGSEKLEDSEARTVGKARDDVTGGRRRYDDMRSGDDVARGAHGTAEQAKDTVKDATWSVAQKASDTAGRIKDTAWETVGQARDKASGIASHAEHKAGEAKHRTSSGTGDATAKAKGGNNGEEKEEEQGTTIVGDVLEAVGATVLGLAQHTKGIIVGEEEVVPGDVVESGKTKIAGAKEEKRKTA